MAKITWHGHPQHFIGNEKCWFRLATEVRGRKGAYMISTIGDYRVGGADADPALIGGDRLYETYIFRLGRSRQKCGCPRVSSWTKLEGRGANTAKKATALHMDAIERWSKVADGEGDE